MTAIQSVEFGKFEIGGFEHCDPAGFDGGDGARRGDDVRMAEAAPVIAFGHQLQRFPRRRQHISVDAGDFLEV
jgi:hypothetical protein